MKSRVRCGVGVVAAVVFLAGGGCGGGGMLSGTGGGNVSTGAGGTGGLLGTAGSGLATGGGGTGDCICCDHAIPATRLLPDILIVVDTSATMNEALDASGSRWAAATAGINMAVDAAPVAANWGLAFLASATDACGTGDRLPLGSSFEIRPALAYRSDGTRLAAPGNRPTRAAIELAAAYLSGRTSGGYRIIALVTDGGPDCRPGADALADDAAGTVRAIGAAADDSIFTAVIGLGTSGGPADATLSLMAAAGRLGRATSPAYVPASSAADVAAAFTPLVRLADCAFAVPPPPTNDGNLSRGQISVRGDTTTIVHDPANGWTYTDATLTGVQLHGSACDAVQSGAITTVFVVFSCHPGP